MIEFLTIQYALGNITKEQLLQLVDLGKLSEEQLKQITSE